MLRAGVWMGWWRGRRADSLFASVRGRSSGKKLQLLRREDRDGAAVDLNEFFLLHLAENPGDGLAGGSGEVCEFLVSERHGELHHGLAAGGAVAPFEQDGGESSGGRGSEGQPPGVEECGFILFGQAFGC